MEVKTFEIVVTPPSGPRIPKNIGDPISASISFKHKGKGVPAYVSWGITPGSAVPGKYYADKIVWIVSRVLVETIDSIDWRTYTIPGLSGRFPALDPVAELGVYYNGFDCYVVVEAEGVVKLSGWWDDVYVRADFVVKPDFEDLKATFT